MASDWREVTIGEFAPFVYGKGLPERDRCAAGSIPVYGSNGVVGTHDEALTDGPTVVIGRKGTVGAVHYSPGPCWPIDTTFYLTGRDEALTRYRYYALKSVGLEHMNADSAIPGLNREAAHARRLRVPVNDQEQRDIAHVLSTLDDRIEINRRISETLEAKAKTLFKSWFMDFDPVRAKAEGRSPGLPPALADLFPNSFADSRLGEIPRGWQAKTIEQVAVRVGMGPFGSSIKVDSFVSDGIPIISGQHLRGVVLDDSTFNFISEDHAGRLRAANVHRGDVVFTHAGNIGQVAFVPENSRYDRYVISQRQFFMRCDPSQVTPSFVTLYFQSPEGQHRLLANASSSGVPSIARPVTYLRSILLVLPPISVMRAFDRLVQPLFALCRHNLDETGTFAALRDALLPKLVSGELRVSGI